MVTVVSAPAPAPASRHTPLPVTHSIVSAQALERELEASYVLGSPVRCRLLRPGTNDSYEVRTPRGRFVAHVYGARWRTSSNIAFQVELLGHLAARGVGVALPVLDRDGAAVRVLQAPEGSRSLVLFHDQPGRRLSWDDLDDCALLGRITAEIHEACHGFTPRARGVLLDAEHLTQRPCAMLRPFLAHRPRDREWLDGFVERLAARLAELDRRLDHGVCHGDTSGRTVRRSPDGALAAVGFDLCGVGWRAFDLAAVAWVADARGDGAIWRAFEAGYRTARPLKDPDTAALPLFHVVRQLWSLGLRAENAADWGSTSLGDAYLDRKLSFFRRSEAAA